MKLRLGTIVKGRYGMSKIEEGMDIVCINSDAYGGTHDVLNHSLFNALRNALFGIVVLVPVYTPGIIIGSKEDRITKNLATIGKGKVNVIPDIKINDPERYISKIHAKIFTDSGGNYYMGDCSINGTFIYTGGTYKKITRQCLRDNDVIAFCYSPTKELYMLLTFKTDEESKSKSDNQGWNQLPAVTGTNTKEVAL